MKINLRLNTNGHTKKYCNEIIANSVLQYIRLKERQGLIGESNPIHPYEIQKVIETSVMDNHFLSIASKTHRHYEPKLEQIYRKIMSSYIRKNDTNLKTKNPFYLPYLVYIDGRGYVIVDCEKTIKTYQEERSDKLNGGMTTLTNRVFDAEKYLGKLLGTNSNDLLEETKSRRGK